MTLKLTKIGIVVVATAAVTSPAIAAPQCPTLAETNAERVRILQTELMVAALKCRNQADLNLFEKYNAFVRKFTPELVEHGKSLTGYFERSYGASYRQKMDKYITTLANTVSIASDKDPEFCEISSQQADAVLAGAGSVTLASYTVSNPDLATLASCGPTVDATLTADGSTVATAE